MKTHSRLAFALTCKAILCFLLFQNSHGAEKPDWQPEWERTVEAAKKEGEVVFYGGELFEKILQEFQKKYPQVKVTSWAGGTGGGGEHRGSVSLEEIKGWLNARSNEIPLR